MNLSALLISAYFAIGLSLMIVTLDRTRREQRSKGVVAPGGGEPPIAVGRLIFIALLWPVWLLACRRK